MAFENGQISKHTTTVPNDTENCVYKTASARASLFLTIFRQEDYIGGGATANARLTLDMPLKRYAPCDFLGRLTGEYQPLNNGGFSVTLSPWQVKTFRVER